MEMASQWWFFTMAVKTESLDISPNMTDLACCMFALRDLLNLSKKKISFFYAQFLYSSAEG